jgi:hypothetical protein
MIRCWATQEKRPKCVPGPQGQFPRALSVLLQRLKPVTRQPHAGLTLRRYSGATRPRLALLDVQASPKHPRLVVVGAANDYHFARVSKSDAAEMITIALDT